MRIADEQAAAGVVSGRPNVVAWKGAVASDPRFHDLEPGDTALGRFGLKARSPTLDDFVADAYRGDMSITSPLRPDEAGWRFVVPVNAVKRYAAWLHTPVTRGE